MASKTEYEDGIPVVDFSAFISGGPGQSEKIGKEVFVAFRDVGFVYLKDHGLSQEIVDEAFSWVRIDATFSAE